MLIDLHTHSTVSDGTDTPAQLVAKAAAAGLSVVALTDHDSTLGWPSAVEATKNQHITLVRGVEFSARWHGITVHLLSFLGRPNYRPLVDQMDKIHQSRTERARIMVGKLAKDYPITWQEVAASGPKGVLGRPHLADALVAAGVVANRSAAFDSILHNSSSYYVPHYAPEAATMIGLIRASGGVPVMAHPGATRRQRIVPDQAIQEMADAGLAGLEVYHRDNPAAQRRRLEHLAEQLKLLITGASDYHGSGKPNRLAEHTTTPEVLDQIVEQGALAPVENGLEVAVVR